MIFSSKSLHLFFVVDFQFIDTIFLLLSLSIDMLNFFQSSFSISI